MIGVLGAGDIAEIYLQNLPRLGHPPVAIASRRGPQAIAARYGLRAMTPEALLADPSVQIVLNLTPAAAHFETTRAALLAGKHVYSEKPLASTMTEARELVRIADAHGLRLAIGPDTVLGPAVQTARRLVAEGAIGTPVLALASKISGGMEHRHPAPHGFYAKGAGPVMDVGPYPIAALIEILGPVSRVCGLTHAGRPERIATAGDGLPFRPSVATTNLGLLRFACGAVGNLVTTWDAVEAEPPLLAIHGTEGTITLPDPNWFGGTVRLHRRGAALEGISTDALPFGNQRSAKNLPVADWRGSGLAEMVRAIEQGRLPHLSHYKALHLLEIASALSEPTDGWNDMLHTDFVMQAR